MAHGGTCSHCSLGHQCPTVHAARAQASPGAPGFHASQGYSMGVFGTGVEGNCSLYKTIPHTAEHLLRHLLTDCKACPQHPTMRLPKGHHTCPNTHGEYHPWWRTTAEAFSLPVGTRSGCLPSAQKYPFSRQFCQEPSKETLFLTSPQGCIMPLLLQNPQYPHCPHRPPLLTISRVATPPQGSL